MDKLEDLINLYARLYAETRDKKTKELIDKISSQSIDLLAENSPYASVLKQKYENKKYGGK